MFSYWEQQSFSKYNFIVIGGGIVGLNSAINLKEKFPHLSVVVLERGLLPSGASTRNAGFACMGSASELLEDLKNTSEEQVVQLFEQRKLGLLKMRARLGDQNIDYKAQGSHEILNETELPVLDKLKYLNQLFFSVLNKNAFEYKNPKNSSFGLSLHYTKALIETTAEGSIDTGKMMRTLINLALSKGIEIKTGASVISFEENENQVKLLINNPIGKQAFQLTCEKLLICTNAFVKQLLPDEAVLPGRGQVLITKPIKDLKIKGIFHFEKGYYYFREIEGRVLFGGGRNIDFKTEETIEMGLNDQIQQDLEMKLKNIILPNHSFEIESRWSGIMAFGNNKTSIIKSISKNTFGAFRCGGMGVALGTTTAEDLVNLLNES